MIFSSTIVWFGKLLLTPNGLICSGSFYVNFCGSFCIICHTEIHTTKMFISNIPSIEKLKQYNLNLKSDILIIICIGTTKN